MNTEIEVTEEMLKVFKDAFDKCLQSGTTTYDTVIIHALKNVMQLIQTQSTQEYINIIFDGPPSNSPISFIEVENDEGKGIKVGEWIDKGDVWSLRIPLRVSPITDEMIEVWAKEMTKQTIFDLQLCRNILKTVIINKE